MTPDEELERMARAMYETGGNPFDHVPNPWALYLDLARAAREASRKWSDEKGFALDAILSALSSQGYVVVPVEPTKEMLIEGETASELCHDETRDSNGSSAIWDDMRVASAVYRAMIQAATLKDKG